MAEKAVVEQTVMGKSVAENPVSENGMAGRAAVHPQSAASGSNFSIDRGRPIADQIFSHLTGAITAGDIPPGTRLPSIRALAAELGVNRNTVAHAIKELADKGFVQTRYGGGSIARLPPPEFPRGMSAPAAFVNGAQNGNAPMTEEEWEQRFASRLNGFLTSASAPLFPGETGQPINLRQLRPDTSLFPLEKFRQCLNTVLRRNGRHLLNYGSPGGYLPLREQIAKRLREVNIPADSSSILVMSGSQQGIDLLARAFINDGENVVVESPTYSIALKIFAANGARFLPYRIERGGIDFEALEQLGPQHPPKLIYTVPNFQNPTTHSYTVEEKAHLLEQAYRLGCVVIEDASDIELHQQPSRWPPLASMDGTGRVIYLNTFSKTLVPALRVGYLCAPPSLVRKLSQLKEMSDLSQSLILQAGIAEFMERGYYDQHVEDVSRAYRERMERVLEILEKALPAEVHFTRPDGGLCVWVDLPEHVDPDRLSEHLRGQGLLVSPGSLYRPLAGGRNGIRLSVANEPEQRLREGFALLGKVLQRVLRQPPPTAQEREYQPIH